jgi:hypothetical protein
MGMKPSIAVLVAAAVAGCYVPGPAPSNALRVTGGMQWADVSLVPHNFIDRLWAPFFGPYRVLIDEERIHYCAVDAITYQIEVDRKRVFPCAWRAIRP